MSWWKKFVTQSKLAKREIRTGETDSSYPTGIKSSSFRKLNEKDKAIIQKIEKELIASGVLGKKEEKFEITDRIEDILQIAQEQGLENVKELIGDFELDEEISSAEGGDNFVLDDGFDEIEDIGYDEYKEIDFDSEIISVKADGENGSVALRLPDGTTIQGTIPSDD